MLYYLNQCDGDGSQVFSELCWCEQWNKDTQLFRQLKAEPPVPLVVHFEELLQPGKVGVPLLLPQQFEEVR